jgi:integrase
MRRYYLRQRKKNGNWYAIFMNTATKKQEFTRCTGTADKRQADLIAQRWLENGPPESNRANCKIAARNRNVLFCDYIWSFWDYDSSEYFKEKITEGKEPKRRHPLLMKGIIDLHYAQYFKGTLLCEITEEKLTEFLVHLKTERNYSASYLNKVRNAAIMPLRYAKRKKTIRGFDFDQIIKIHGKSAERGILDRCQAGALFKLEWRDARSRLVNLIASQTAMRMGEILSLRVCDILKDRINVQHSWSYADGGLTCTKNRSSRVIPILPELFQELDAFIAGHGRASRPDNLVFIGRTEGKPYSFCMINNDLHEMLEKIGISDAERRKRNIVFHSWRHYGAKNLAEVTTRQIGMAILGHKTPTLFDHYANHADDETFNLMKTAISEGLHQGAKEGNFPNL